MEEPRENGLPHDFPGLGAGVLGRPIRIGDGCTPLHLAALRGRRLMVEMLVAKGGDINAMEAHQLTPEDLARNEGHEDVARFLAARAGRQPK